MKKIVSAIISIILVVCTCSSMVNAFSGNEHDIYLRHVLFGSAAVSNTDILDAINDASELALDQHGGDSQGNLDELRNGYGVKNIPKKVSSFNVGHGNTHRNYTHRGWNYNYKKNDGKDEAHWSDIRKKILLETINQKFKFGFLSGKFGIYDKQCDAMGALVYYVHVIGDHISNEEYHNNYKEIPLVARDGQNGIIEELLKYSRILFEHSKENNATYDRYISELQRLQSQVDEIYHYPDDLADPDTYQQYHEYAIELMDCLENYVPLLIKREPFFQKAFYPEMIKK